MSFETVTFCIDTRKAPKDIDNEIKERAKNLRGTEVSRSPYASVQFDGKTYLYFWVRFQIND